jgi:hypothetical protein
VDEREISDGNLALPVEDLVDVSPPAAGGHVPLGHIADSLGMFQEWAGNQGDIAECGTPEVGHHGASSGGGTLHLLAKVFNLLVGDGGEFFEVVVGIQPVLVDGRLAHDGVKEIAAARHAAAGRDAGVALGIDESVAAGIHGNPEILRDQDLEAIRHAPGLPIVVGETEHRFAGEHTLDVEPQGALQIFLQQTEHLVGFVDLDGSIL